MNSEYAEFIKSEGYTIPSNWVDGKYKIWRWKR